MSRRCLTRHTIAIKGGTEMQLALTLDPFQDADLLFAQQLGADQIMADVPGWDADTLSRPATASGRGACK